MECENTFDNDKCEIAKLVNCAIKYSGIKYPVMSISFEKL